MKLAACPFLIGQSINRGCPDIIALSIMLSLQGAIATKQSCLSHEIATPSARNDNFLSVFFGFS